MSEENVAAARPVLGVPRHLRGSALLLRRLRLTRLRRARRERLAAVEGGGFGLGPLRLLAAAGHEEEGRPARLSPVERHVLRCEDRARGVRHVAPGEGSPRDISGDVQDH